MTEHQETRALSRRELLAKVGMYGAPAVLAGGVLLRSGVAFGAGEVSQISSSQPGPVSQPGSSQCVPSEGSRSSSAFGGSCSTPLDFLQTYLGQLQSIPTPSNKGDQRKLAGAIAALSSATDGSKWQPDGTTLVAPGGRRVFHDLANAIEALSALKVSSPLIASIIQGIVTQAGTVANAAYNNATLSAKRAQQVQRLLAKAAQKAARGNYESAIEAYSEAWSKSTRGAGHEDGDEGDDD